MEVIDIPIIIDLTYQIKPNIDSKWIFTDIIYEGYNTINIACLDNNCQYVAKIIKIKKIYNEFNEYGCFTTFDKTRNELFISKLMSEAGIGPMIYDMSLNEDEGIIIMEKYDGTLDDLLWLYQFDKNIRMDKFLNDTAILLAKMHSLNISHGDLHTDNIFYNKSGKIVISDFGQSLYTTSQELIDKDWASFKGIKGLYNRIKEGIKKIDRDNFFNIFSKLTPRNPYIFSYTWKGKKCDWYPD